MTVFEQLKAVLKDRIHDIVTPIEVKDLLANQFGTNPSSIILSDYCYNRYNSGISFNKHLFQYINRGCYKYLGENYPYTGFIFHKPKGQTKEIIVGEWKNGVKTLYEESLENKIDYDQMQGINKDQIKKLYEEYNNILRIEMNILNCEPTELRHLIGRIGEFLCAIYTGGILARETNQHGFDVLNKGRRISVKTTAQTSGFITINQNTFKDFDDLFVVQYVNDEFKIIYYGPKEPVKEIVRSYDNNFELDINRLKSLYKTMNIKESRYVLD